MSSNKTKKSEAKEDQTTFVNHAGVGFTSKVIKGERPKPEDKEQSNERLTKADKASITAGVELAKDLRSDEQKVIDQKVEDRLEYYEKAGYTPPGSKVVDTKETLYHGFITGEATAAATGEQVSILFEQGEPTTEDGLFHSFRAYHPSAIRSTFKFHTDGKGDPNKRTYLEKP